VVAEAEEHAEEAQHAARVRATQQTHSTALLVVTDARQALAAVSATMQRALQTLAGALRCEPRVRSALRRCVCVCAPLLCVCVCSPAVCVCVLPCCVCVCAPLLCLTGVRAIVGVRV
jgi:hypothetical protein